MHAPAAQLTLQTVYREHYAFVWRVVQRLGVADAAVDDAVQDVFVVVSKRLPEFEGRASITSWLYAIAKRVVMHHHRARFRHERRKDALEQEAPTPSDGYARSDAARTLHRLLDDLDPARREVFVLAELEGMTAPEISELLGVKVPTVYSRLRAARLELEQAVSRMREGQGGEAS